MSYPDIPRFATSWNCSRAQYRKVWLFENASRCSSQKRRWDKENPTYERLRYPVSYQAATMEGGEPLDIGLYSILQSGQKSPLELLMEKEEAA